MIAVYKPTDLSRFFRNTLFLLNLFLVNRGTAQTNSNPVFEWAKNLGNASDEYSYSIAVDPSGNVYITGFFFYTTDFDPGIGTAILTPVGDRDIFFAKYNASGDYLWAKSVGSQNTDMGSSIAIDFSGNVYVAGSFQTTADFDPGTGTANLTAVGNYDIFIAKYNASGGYLWAKNAGSIFSDGASSIAVDPSGNVYVTGSFQATADFDPGAGTTNLTAVGSYDIFIAKFNVSGDYLWAKNVGSIAGEIVYGISVDQSGNVCITGSFQDTIDFDPSAGTANLIPVGSDDIFIAKYNTSGDYLWANNMGSLYNDYGTSVAVDPSGNVYVTGHFQDTVDFDPGAGTANLTAVGLDDIFIAKYNAAGDYLWAIKIGSMYSDNGYSIAIDSLGNAYVTGSFQATADFDPSAGISTLTSIGIDDIFIAKYNSSGNYLWAKKVGGSYDDYGSSMAVDSFGFVYLTGSFKGTADFDPGAGTSNLTSVGGHDNFIAKYFGSCNISVTWSSNNVSCFNGSDGMVSVTTTGGNAPYDFFWNNGFDTSTISNLNAGTYSVTVTDSFGCSVISYVTIGQPLPLSLSLFSNPDSGNSDGTTSVTANGGTPPYSYYWSSGDTSSSVSDLPSSVYFVTVTDANGCTTVDSVLVDFYVDIPFQISSASGGQISIIPNPNKGEFELSVTGNLYPAISINVYNVLGELIHQKPNTVYRLPITVDIQKQGSGIYYVQVISETVIITEKIVIE